MAADRKQIVRDSYPAFAAGGRSFFEQRLSDDFLFSALRIRSSAVMATLSGAGPGRGGVSTSISPTLRAGDEVVVTYESNVSGAGRGRNTEVITFDDDDKIARTEVYFGWNREQAPAARATRS